MEIRAFKTEKRRGFYLEVRIKWWVVDDYSHGNFGFYFKKGKRYVVLLEERGYEFPAMEADT